MKKFLLSIALVLFAGATMAQSTIDLTFSRNNSTAGTDATVAVASTGDLNVTGITSTVACNYNWKAFGANSETFPNGSIICPDKNTKDMTGDAAGVITLTLNGVPENYEFTKVTFTSVALNGGGAFQSDNANAQHVDFILKQDETNVAESKDIAIKVNSNGGESVTVNLVPTTPIKAADGTVTLKVNIVNNYTAYGCFYGLIKVSIETTMVAIPEPTPVVDFYHPGNKNLTATELMSVTKPTYIAIKGLANKNNEYWNYVSGDANTSTQYFNQNAIFVWEPVNNGVAGSYYLRKVNSGYMQASNPGAYAETTEGAAVFTAVKPTEVASGANGEGQFNRDANSDSYIAAAGGYDYIVRLVTNGKWLNIGDRLTSAQAPAFNNGYGTFTIYQICELKGFGEKINVAIKNTGDVDYATFYSNAPVQLPEGVTAYYVKEGSLNNGYVTLTADEDGIIAGNTGVILSATVGADADVALTVLGANVAQENGNLLKGTEEDTIITEDAYVLGKVDGEIGLYKALTTDGSWKNNANKAYLPATEGMNAVAYSFRNADVDGDDDATAIEEVETENAEVVIYDLAGRRINEITEGGIYIIGGRKVLVK